MVSSRVVWPHELFAWMFENHHQAFIENILGGSTANIKKFWAHMPPRAGLADRDGWKEKAIPIAIHGDEVAISNIRGKSSKQVDCLSWTSLLATGQTRMTQFLIWFAFVHLCKKTGFSSTWSAFWAKLTLSLQALWTGRWPEQTMDGEAHPKAGQLLAGGFFAFVYCNRGDLDFMAAHFNLSHASSRMPCSLCSCTNIGPGDEQPWTDCNNEPSWLRGCLTDQELNFTHQACSKKSQVAVLQAKTNWKEPIPEISVTKRQA